MGVCEKILGSGVRRGMIVAVRGDEELSEGVVANLAEHRRAAAEPRHAHRDIARGAARLGSETRFSRCTARWHKVDDQFPKGDDVVMERSRRGAAIFATRSNGSHGVLCHPTHVRPSAAFRDAVPQPGPNLAGRRCSLPVTR